MKDIPFELSDLKIWTSFIFKERIAWLAASSFFINIGLIIPPMFGMLIYDKVVHNGIFETLWALSIGVVIFLAAEITVKSLRVRDIERVALEIDKQIDERLFNSLLKPSSRSGMQPGMAAKFMTLYRDLSAARDFFSSHYLIALTDLPFLIVIFIVIGIIAWQLLIVVVLSVLIYIAIGSSLKKKALDLGVQVADLQTKKLALLTDAMSSLDSLRTSYAGQALRTRFQLESTNLAKNNHWLRLQSMAQNHWTQAIYLVNYVSILIVGSYLVFGQYITVGAMMAVSMLSGRTLGATGQVLVSISRWNEFKSSMKVLAPYLSSPIDIPNKENINRPLSSIIGKVFVQQISHKFSNNKDVLTGINFQIQPNEHLGIVGRSGSGKSTLLRILAGAIQPTHGEIKIDYVNLFSISHTDRFEWLGFKPQEAPLMAGTLESNILMNLSPSASIDERMRALKRGLFHACLDQDLDSGSLSLDYFIEEYGANLSGGQRQKIALARVFATNPKFYLLDEPTNGLDTETENTIIKRMTELQDATFIIVSHNSQVLALTQRLIVLEQGRLIADGLTSKMLTS
jgi:ATP-binding cassette subfamily B protein/ATP-binding cassette subfamily C protein LapB